MVSVQHLLDHCQHRTTIVFGNLGRRPDKSRITSQSMLTPSFLNPTLACTFVWKNRHCVYESFGSDVGYRSRLKVLSRGSFPVSPSLLGASKYGNLLFGSLALHATGGCVRDLVDVVGRLGNASRREPTLACSVSPTLETGFGNTCGTLASELFGPWDAL
ncbi:hypothetical protein TNCV_2947891 [Trichonephila clavipes]|nr:hypothetical protein TNCV_2947891 [Trichonephila clavipes]